MQHFSILAGEVRDSEPRLQPQFARESIKRRLKQKRRFTKRALFYFCAHLFEFSASGERKSRVANSFIQNCFLTLQIATRKVAIFCLFSESRAQTSNSRQRSLRRARFAKLCRKHMAAEFELRSADFQAIANRFAINPCAATCESLCAAQPSSSVYVSAARSTL